MHADDRSPRLSHRREGERLLMGLAGDWLLSDPARLRIDAIADLLDAPVRTVTVRDEGIGRWDSSLALWLQQLYDLCQSRGLELHVDQLPEGLRRLLQLATAVPPARTAPPHPERGWLAQIGRGVLQILDETYAFVHFIGEATLAALRFIRGKARYRPVDLWLLLQECGPGALPIVTLIALLVGLILAYVGALQLQMFGAQIYVASLVGIGTLREMGAMMTAIIMAGRTGSAYAAQLGTMQVNEEIDAFRTLGLSPMEFLVIPRMLALIVMVPLLTLYADLVGMLGGALAAVTVFDLTLLEYITQTRASLGLSDVIVGLVKAAVFGILIATAGCLQGIRCQRSAQAVGEASTAAVVTAIVAIVVADSLLTILFTRLGV
ncbi:phospholipid/cholesterol/gamma-HCH transport system permease protein [Methylomarinovum tepidoasis]|uniref:Phospholipid/cholesterol/gamma-HCH transport system permease protein n=1 Tax=Methylomarinovum tepidoasis TaxID=2840183 RepID=A0AAU9C9A6_9GAMM|nr:ABC transporter permease [Methylomarinovum sp. IN45]BCX89899.1 phospholipid/cholesterol/gamma-HCH transport system permease protein [Methylomarinovum sp. IN45]